MAKAFARPQRGGGSLSGDCVWCSGYVCARRVFRLGGWLLALALVFVAVYAVPRSLSEWLTLRAGAAAYAAALSAAPSLSGDEVIPVLMPMCGRGMRSGYVRMSLAALRAASGSSSTILVVSDDCNDAEAGAAVEEAAAAGMRVVRLSHSPPLLGLPALLPRCDAATAANVFFLLRFAFDWAHAHAAVVLEEDIVLAPDALEYFAWALAHGAVHPATRGRLFTVNGYYAGSAPPPPDTAPPLYDVATREAGFMVWGWALPAASWPAVRRGWTWFANWDFAVEAARASAGGISLSPLVSRTRNVGMRGINFDIADPAEAARWTSHYMPHDRTDFEGHAMRVWETAAEARAGRHDKKEAAG